MGKKEELFNLKHLGDKAAKVQVSLRQNGNMLPLRDIESITCCDKRKAVNIFCYDNNYYTGFFMGTLEECIVLKHINITNKHCKIPLSEAFGWLYRVEHQQFLNM